MSEDWTKEWERRIVNGVYPLRRFLGRSNHSVVFLTECKAQNLAQAAIKILPAHPALAESQLSYWRRAEALSHPHLIRLFDSGRCRLGGHKFLFVVMDLAEQNLAQILPGRPLTADEVRDLLPPTLDALAYLHGKNFVQGRLKPPNFLVVDDQLKLASDTIRPAGDPTASIAKPSLYDPPEAKHGRISTAGDIWGLGITLVEALTQAPPAWSRERSDPVALPADLPPEYADALRRCLSRDPAHRPTCAELAAEFKPAAATPASATPSAANEPVVGAPPTHRSSKTRLLVTAMTVGVMALWAVWAAVHLSHSRANIPQVAAMTAQSQPVVSRPAAVEIPQASTAALPTVLHDSVQHGTVLHEEMPDVSRRARDSIRGLMTVVVRVTVDSSGDVVAATLENRVASKYFAHAATQAAQKWKFVPAGDQASRVRLLRFDFTRAGTVGQDAALVAAP
jgi:TonB family protein